MEVKEGLTFTKKDISGERVNYHEYIECRFDHCSFENSDLSNSIFTDCEFQDCNLSNISLINTTLNNCEFIECKLLGMNLSEANDFLLSLNFKSCFLDHSIFVGLKLKGTRFIQCSVKAVDFSSTDLTGAVFEESNLESARFDSTNLEKADLRTAYSYSIDPELNRMKGARFSSMALGGLLDKYNIKIE